MSVELNLSVFSLYGLCSAVIATMSVANTINVYRIIKAQKGGVAKLSDTPVEFPKVCGSSVVVLNNKIRGSWVWGGGGGGGGGGEGV